MNGAGIDTIALLSTDHAWNMIKINDSWYHTDCTWDDMDGYSGYEMIYNFFNRSESVIRSDGTHEIQSMFDGKLPASTLDSGAGNTSNGKFATQSKKTATPKVTYKTVKNGVQVTISSNTSNTEIYYTTNGQTASSSYTKSHRYKKPFTISKKTTIKAIAVKDTYWNSDQTSKTVDGRVYTVNFKSNGGSSVSKQYVQYNKVIKKPSNPTRSKYTFAGWYTDSNLTKAWDFNTKIKSGKTLYAKWKKISLKQAVISKVQNVSGKKIKVTVKKVSGADGYQIQYSTKSNMKSAKTVTSSKTTTTISKLSKGKKYYVRVKAYKKDSTGKKVAGKWSIEKMAEDEAYRKKYEGIISGAQTQLAQIKNGLGSNASHVKGYGIKINDNGTASLFAVIDKSLAAQKERIAKNAKTRAEEKKVAEKKADKKKTEEKQELKNDKSKKAEEKEDYVTVTASSVEELLKKINDTIYDSMSDHVKTPQEQLLGQHINFSA